MTATTVARRPRRAAPIHRPPRRGPDLARVHLTYHQTRDPEARERLFDSYVPLARSIANRFRDRGEPLDDLLQVAFMGLLHALDRFDPQRGFQFTTFATATISGELKRHFRDRAWAMRVSRRQQELYLATRDALESLTLTLGRSPTLAEIGEQVQASDIEVAAAIEAGHAAYRLRSLDAPIDDDGATRGTTIGADDGAFGLVDDRGMLARLMDRLPERERRIIHLRFVEDRMQSEIAAEVGLSQMHVSRLIRASVDRMRQWANAEEA